jgi:ribosomal protein L16 Arg81 hydroxylase
MGCKFLEDFSFSRLLQPVTEADFRALHWEKYPLIMHRGDPNFYDDLFDVRDFDLAVASAPAYVKVAKASTKKNRKHDGGTTAGLENVLADMRDGATLALDGLNKRHEKLGLLCRLLSRELGHPFQTNLYLTPPNGQGFTPHWDNHDVFILQVFGKKKWWVEKQRRTLPSRKEHMGDEGRELAPDSRSFTLAQGDMIYIPRGFVHAAECESEPSLHITLGILAYTWGDLLHAAINAATLEDKHLEHALPLGFIHGDTHRLVERVGTVLRGTAEANYLNAVVDRFKDELVTRFPIDVSGQITTFFQASQLVLEDKAGPRGGILYRMHDEEKSVRLNVGGRVITFPDFFAESLRFALSTPVYRIREIAGDLEDEEKIVFVERLMQEGMVVRK